jgi:hypothetical protein
MAFAMAKARIGTTMSSLQKLNVELERRQEEFNGRNRTLADGEVPAGFVEQNGRLIPFWWSKVSRGICISSCLEGTLRSSREVVLTHDTGGPHHQVVRLPRPHRPLYSLHDHRLLPREAPHQEGSEAPRISSRKSPKHQPGVVPYTSGRREGEREKVTLSPPVSAPPFPPPQRLHHP